MNKHAIENYFTRIGLSVPEQIVPDGELLRNIHYAHMLYVPYENIDYLNRNILPVDATSVYHRVVEQGRGGVCLDLNTLFAWLLRELGYNVTELATHPAAFPERTFLHKALLVEDCNGAQWWCDVGRTFPYMHKPLRFVPGIIQQQGCTAFLLEEQPADGSLAMKFCFGKEEWKTDLIYKGEVFSPERTFENKLEGLYGDPTLLCEQFSIRTPYGFRTLLGNVYRESFNDVITKHICAASEMKWAYRQFGLKYPASSYFK